MSYKITSKSELAPDAEPLLQRLKFLGPLLTFFMAKWSKTQTYNAVDQLKSGVRYFDLRLATKKGCDEIYFVHGLYSCCVDEVLNEINDFLSGHPKEVVVFLLCVRMWGLKHLLLRLLYWIVSIFMRLGRLIMKK